MRIFIIILLLFVGQVSFACINEYRTLLTGEVVYKDATGGKIWTQEIDTVKLRIRANEILADYQRTNSTEDLSDYAATLIYLGDYKKAKEIYQGIEKEFPDLYTTASNLGTIYELEGKPDSAFMWIKKSMEINPDSHDGSEWIHLKILEFKIAKKTDYAASILGLDFGEEVIPKNPKNYELRKMQNHIIHQLSERSNFVKPKNKVVGNIYFDYGNVLAQTDDLESALEIYAAAKEYGFSSDLMDKRIKKFESMTGKAKQREEQKVVYDFTAEVARKNRGVIQYILLGLGLFFVIGLTWLVRRAF